MEKALKALENKIYINNEYVLAQGDKCLTLSNPATGDVVSDQVAIASLADVDCAVQAAEAAMSPGSPWRTMAASDRAACFWKLSELICDPVHADILGRLDGSCFGRPISQFAAMDLVATRDGLRYYAGWVDKFHGDCHTREGGFIKCVRREPIGVCAGIIAWNGPIPGLFMKVGPALATGNVLILKPSEKTPLGALYVADLFRQAGFPSGVFQVVTGAGDVGAVLASHMRIRKISFTGSVATGKKIQEAAAKSNLKRVTLELGGKSPLIVFDDAKLDLAAFWGANTIALNSGQYCVAASRVYVQEAVYESFLAKYKAGLEQIARGTGDPCNKDTVYGPVADKLQFDRVSSYIEAGKKEATLFAGGKMDDGGKGLFITPTVFVDPKLDAKIYKEEIFGPVSTVMKFKTEEEVVALANDSEYGLSAGVFTQDLDRAWRMTSLLESGTVCINAMSMVTTQTPFGGVKQSGYGSEGGMDSLLAYTQVKTVIFTAT